MCKFPQDGSPPKSLRYIGRYFSLNFVWFLAFFQNVFVLTMMSNAVWLLISIELCFMVVSSCTQLMQRVQTESYGTMYFDFAYRKANSDSHGCTC